MISYNPKIGITNISSVDFADTTSQLMPIILHTDLYANIIAYSELEYFKLPEDSHVRYLSVTHAIYL